MIEPVGKRGVEIDHVALRIHGEKARRRVIQIIDGVLQFLKDVFLTFALAGDIGDRPDREVPRVHAFGKRTYAQPQPAGRAARQAGDPHFLLQSLSFARRFKEPVDRLGGIRIADEDALHRPQFAAIGGVDKIQIGGISVNHAPVPLGDENAVKGVVDKRLNQRVSALRRRQAENAGAERE